MMGFAWYIDLWINLLGIEERREELTLIFLFRAKEGVGVFMGLLVSYSIISL